MSDTIKQKKSWFLKVGLLVIVCVVVVWVTKSGTPGRIRAAGRALFEETSIWHPRHTLTDLKGFAVLVKDLETEEENTGLTSQQLQQDIEDKLEESGIEVYDIEEGCEDIRVPWLYLKINSTTSNVLKESSAMVNSPTVYAYSVTLVLHQKVRLFTTPPKACEGAVTWGWKNEVIGITTSPENFCYNIREATKHIVEGFILDYFEANPDLVTK